VSLYREARSERRRLWIAASAAVLALAVAAGVVLATSGGAPSQEEKLESLQDDVQPALEALELIPIHYESPNRTTHAAAADQLEVARKAVASVEAELRTLDPVGTSRVLADLAALRLLVRTTGRTDVIERVTSETASDLRALVRLD
jgi:hypothetical protein